MGDSELQTTWRGRLLLIVLAILLCVGGIDVGSSIGFVDSVVQAENDDEGDEGDEVELDEVGDDDGGGHNIVQRKNHKDGRLRVRARIQLNRITSESVTPVNSAYAYSSCTDCQTIAVAMQINLISPDAREVAPVNEAVAINYECNRCITVAIALQYVYTVDDPNQVPEDVDRLIKQMNRELKAVAKDKDATLQDVANRVDAVIAQFQELATSLNDERDESTERTSPDATPEAPEASPEASPRADLTEPSETTTPVTTATWTSNSGTNGSGSSEPTAQPTNGAGSAAPTKTPIPEPTEAPNLEASPPA